MSERSVAVKQEPVEIVGSTSLKDVLLEHGIIHGTWWLNRHEFRNFEASNPAHVPHFINQATSKTGVTASIDDGFHLVLVSNAPIAIASGHALDREHQRRAIMDRNRSQGFPDRKVEESEIDDPKDVLELLGLTATEEVAAARGADWAPGASKADRDKLAGKDEPRHLPKGESGQTRD